MADMSKEEIEEVARPKTTAENVRHALAFATVRTAVFGGASAGMFYLGAWLAGVADPLRVTLGFCLPTLAVCWLWQLRAGFVDRRDSAKIARDILDMQAQRAALKGGR